MFLKKLRKYKVPYLFISPFFIMFLAFSILPIFYGGYISFHKFVTISSPLRFVGVGNYLHLFKDPRFFWSLKITFLYTVFQVSLMMTLAIVLALILNLNLRGRNFFRMLYFLPAVTSFVVAALIFKLVLDKQVGLVNILLTKVGFLGYGWLEEPKLALLSIILVATWRWTGYQIVILLAGLQAIPHELYEAAKIDGTTTFQITRYITLPLLFPAIFFCVIMSVIGSLQLFDEPYILTSGGPSDATLSTALLIYTTGFRFFKLGYASAMGFILAIIIFIVSLFQIKMFGRRGGL